MTSVWEARMFILPVVEKLKEVLMLNVTYFTLGTQLLCR